MAYTARELSTESFADFVRLARKQGGCWCLYYEWEKPRKPRGSREAWDRAKRREKLGRVREGRSHAVLVYEGTTPIGWCQFGTREELPRIDAGRNYKKVGPPRGPETLWRITCFFVDRANRGRGVARFALKAALQSIKRRGGGVVEAYPVVSERMAAVPEWRWFGTPGMFRREGFREVAPLGTGGVLMRKVVRP